MYKFIVCCQKRFQRVRNSEKLLKNVYSTKVADRHGCNYVDRTMFAGHLSEG